MFILKDFQHPSPFLCLISTVFLLNNFQLSSLFTSIFNCVYFKRLSSFFSLYTYFQQCFFFQRTSSLLSLYILSTVFISKDFRRSSPFMHNFNCVYFKGLSVFSLYTYFQLCLFQRTFKVLLPLCMFSIVFISKGYYPSSPSIPHLNCVYYKVFLLLYLLSTVFIS